MYGSIGHMVDDPWVYNLGIFKGFIWVIQTM